DKIKEAIDHLRRLNFRPEAAFITENSHEELERLRGEIDSLSAQNQALQSRVVELRETSRNQQARIDELLSRLGEQAMADDSLDALRVARAKGRIRMSESHEGVVEDSHGDTVVVVYDVQGDIIEQTYVRSQFIGGRLPEIDTRLVAYVHVVEVDPETVE